MDLPHFSSTLSLTEQPDMIVIISDPPCILTVVSGDEKSLCICNHSYQKIFSQKAVPFHRIRSKGAAFTSIRKSVLEAGFGMGSVCQLSPAMFPA